MKKTTKPKPKKGHICNTCGQYVANKVPLCGILEWSGIDGGTENRLIAFRLATISGLYGYPLQVVEGTDNTLCFEPWAEGNMTKAIRIIWENMRVLGALNDKPYIS